MARKKKEKTRNDDVGHASDQLPEGRRARVGSETTASRDDSKAAEPSHASATTKANDNHHTDQRGDPPRSSKRASRNKARAVEALPTADSQQPVKRYNLRDRTAIKPPKDLSAASTTLSATASTFQPQSQLPHRPSRAASASSSQASQPRPANSTAKPKTYIPPLQRDQLQLPSSPPPSTTTPRPLKAHTVVSPLTTPVPTSRDRLLRASPRMTAPAPVPSVSYLTSTTSLSPHPLPHPRKLLIILDLNGVLIFRRDRRKPRHFARRPHLDAFLSYLFTHHHVMIWSSARASNVLPIVEELFSPAQRAALVAVWTREDCGLSQREFEGHVQVYKRLERVWGWLRAGRQAGEEVEEGEVLEGVDGRRTLLEGYDEGNTVLVDDSVAKAKGEPWNLVAVREWLGEEGDEELVRVRERLVALSGMDHVGRWLFRAANPGVGRVDGEGIGGGDGGVRLEEVQRGVQTLGLEEGGVRFQEMQRGFQTMGLNERP